MRPTGSQASRSFRSRRHLVLTCLWNRHMLPTSCLIYMFSLAMVNPLKYQSQREGTASETGSNQRIQRPTLPQACGEMGLSPPLVIRGLRGRVVQGFLLLGAQSTALCPLCFCLQNQGGQKTNSTEIVIKHWPVTQEKNFLSFGRCGTASQGQEEQPDLVL